MKLDTKQLVAGVFVIAGAVMSCFKSTTTAGPLLLGAGLTILEVKLPGGSKSE